MEWVSARCGSMKNRSIKAIPDIGRRRLSEEKEMPDFKSKVRFMEKLTGHAILEALLDGKFKPRLEIYYQRLPHATDFILLHRHNDEEHSVGFVFTDGEILDDNKIDREILQADLVIVRRLSQVFSAIRCRYCKERKNARLQR